MSDAGNISLLVLDVDGVMTDGGVIYASSGDELKRFDIKDGLGIKLAQRAGIDVAIITGRRSELVERRARELNIVHLHQGREDKLVALGELLESLSIPMEQVAYMGDDLPDLPAIVSVGLGVCPADAVEAIRDAADWITTAPGGHGAVRECVEMLLRARNQLTDIVESYRP